MSNTDKILRIKKSLVGIEWNFPRSAWDNMYEDIIDVLSEIDRIVKEDNNIEKLCPTCGKAPTNRCPNKCDEYH